MSDVEQVVLTAAVSVLFGMMGHWVTQKVSSSIWVAQERWKLKWQLYRDLLTLLHNVGVTIHDLAAAAGSDDTATTIQKTELTSQYLKQWDTIFEMSKWCDVWLEQPAIDAMHRLIHEMQVGTARSAADFNQMLDVVGRVQFEVIQEARRDLNLGAR